LSLFHIKWIAAGVHKVKLYPFGVGLSHALITPNGANREIAGDYVQK
jgi:hypothetical protein